MRRKLDLRAHWARVRAARADIRAARARSEQLIGMSADLAAAMSASRADIEALGAKIDSLSARTAADHERALHALRVVRDQDARAWERLWRLRRTEEYERAFTEDEPLITIIVSTYDNWPQLRERSLPSVLAQTYEHFECLIVGDAAPPEAAEAVRSFGDARLRYVNLPYRGPYPPDRRDAWLIYGTTPFNTALALGNGSWIGSVSDDDALRPAYIESLLALAKRDRAEVPYGQFRELAPGLPDRVVGTFPPTSGHWGIQCSLVHGGLRFLPLQPSDWLFGTPNDWSWAERMLRIGVRFAMLDEAVVDYFPSQLWTDRPEIS